MGQPGKWQTEVGWDTIDRWRLEENWTYPQIRAKCKELTSDGSAPSNGALSPHFNATARENAIERQQKYRSTIRGMLNRRLHSMFEKDQVPKVEESDNRHTTNWQMIRDRLKMVKGRNGMKIDEYIKYWEENAGLKIISEQDWRIPCKICGEEVVIDPKGKDMHLDHIIPESKQGGSTPDNIVPVHKMCNQAKTSMTLKELVDFSKKVVEKWGYNIYVDTRDHNVDTR